MGGGGGGGEGEPEFQIAPMIDVLLALMVFFMSITTAQIESLDKDIKLPVAPDSTPRVADNSLMIINIKWDAPTQKAAYVLDSIRYEDAEALKVALEAKKGNRKDPRVLIRGDKDLQAREIYAVMTSIGQAGIDDVSFSAVNR